MRLRCSANLPACWLCVVISALFVSFTLPAPLPAFAEPPAPVEEEDNAEQQQKEDDEYFELFKLFAEALDQVERNSMKKIERRELVEAAIKGMLSKLDQYSNFIPPEQLNRFKSEVESEFGGVGIQVGFEDDQLTIMSPLVGTPGHKAGLLAGDQIIQIEGESTEGITINGAVTKLKGRPGSNVTFTIRRPGDDKERTITVTREVIRVETVMGDTRKPNGEWDFMYDDEKKIGYIRISAFARRTESELKDALERLQSQGMKGLVLDLRFNPGGLLSSAIEISDMFLSKGRIVSTEGRNVPFRKWDAKRAGTFDGFPIAVLVNHYSASASEIVSACLQDHKRAIVVGERTWGKGSVQNIVELEGGKSVLKLTTAGYKRPNGKNIHRLADAKDSDEWGVRPSDGYEVKMTPREAQSFLRYRQKRDLFLGETQGAVEEADPGSDDESASAAKRRFEDKQFSKALEYLNQQLAESESKDKKVEKAKEIAQATEETP